MRTDAMIDNFQGNGGHWSLGWMKGETESQRSAARCRVGNGRADWILSCNQQSNMSHDGARDSQFGGAWYRVAAVIVEQDHFVVIRAQCTARVVCDEERYAFAPALCFCVFLHALAFGGEADAEGRAVPLCDACQDVARGLQRQAQR